MLLLLLLQPLQPRQLKLLTLQELSLLLLLPLLLLLQALPLALLLLLLLEGDSGCSRRVLLDFALALGRLLDGRARLGTIQTKSAECACGRRAAAGWGGSRGCRQGACCMAGLLRLVLSKAAVCCSLLRAGGEACLVRSIRPVDTLLAAQLLQPAGFHITQPNSCQQVAMPCMPCHSFRC